MTTFYGPEEFNSTIDHLYVFWALFSSENKTNTWALWQITEGYKYIFMNIFKRASRFFVLKSQTVSKLFKTHMEKKIKNGVLTKVNKTNH